MKGYMKKLLIISLFTCASMQASEWDKAKNAILDDDLKELQDAYHNDPTILTRRYGGDDTLLHTAVTKVWGVEFAEFLIMRGADINGQDYHGDTPLMKAVVYGWPDLVKLLLDNHADTSIINNRGRTVFDLIPGIAPGLSPKNMRVRRIKHLLYPHKKKSPCICQ